MPAPEELVKRADWLLGGVARRANEHQWSYARWTRRAGWTLWASVFATAATATAVTTALADNASLAWLATLFAAVAAAVTAYQARTDPAGTATKHAVAQARFELLVSEFRGFVDYRAARMSEAEAEGRFEELEDERKRLIETSVPVEPAAHDALKPKQR